MVFGKDWLAAMSGAALLMAATPVAAAPARGDITIADTGVFPENIAAARDGTVWFGSVAKGTVYRAAPGSSRAEPWILPETSGIKRAMGLFADDRRGLLWVCDSGARATDTTPATAPAIHAFAIRGGKPKAKYAIEGGGDCNDLTVAKDGTVYATDFMGGRIVRLKKGDDRFRAWATDPAFSKVDGVALLADGHVYVNSYALGTMMRVPVQADGSAGAVMPLAVPRALVKPDGMRAVGPATLLMTEGEGRLVEVVVDGDAVRLRTLSDALPDSPTGVALVGGTAYVVQAKWAYMRDRSKDPGPFGAIAIPYAPGN